MTKSIFDTLIREVCVVINSRPLVYIDEGDFGGYTVRPIDILHPEFRSMNLETESDVSEVDTALSQYRGSEGIGTWRGFGPSGNNIICLNEISLNSARVKKPRVNKEPQKLTSSYSLKVITNPETMENRKNHKVDC